MEEIFASLVAALGGDGGGSEDGGNRGGRGCGPRVVATLHVASFVEAGEGGFSHVTMTFDDGNKEGWNDDRRAWGTGRTPAASHG